MKQDHRQMISLSKGIIINFSEKPKAKYQDLRQMFS